MGTASELDAADAERGPGRPREPEVDQRILDAALHLMAQGGYVRMAMDQVAAAAHVTKPTIYRRYAGKLQLALAAISAYCAQEPPARHGETRADLVAELENLRRGLDRPYGMAMLGTMLAEEHETPALLASFREHLVAPRRAALGAILERARERGELRLGADLTLAADMLVGSYYARYLSGAPFPDDWAARVVDAALAGLAQGGA